MSYSEIQVQELLAGARAVWDHVLTPAQRRGLVFVRDGLEANVEGTRTLTILASLKLVTVEHSIASQSLHTSSGSSAISLTAFGEAAIPPDIQINDINSSVSTGLENDE